MKYAWILLRLLLPVAAIVLLTLSMTNQGAHQNGWLCGGLLCSTLGIWLNIWFQRKERKREQ